MWVLEQNVFPADEEQRLIDALTSLNLCQETYTGSDLRARLPIADTKTVLRGSCWLFQQLQAQPSWRSDLWGDETAFEYRNYSTRYAEFLLNYPFTSVSFHELCWKHDAHRVGSMLLTLRSRPRGHTLLKLVAFVVSLCTSQTPDPLQFTFQQSLLTAD